MVILTIVKELRDEIPLIGTRKLLYQLEPHLEEHGIKLGRDQLFDLLRFHGLLIRRRKRMVKTTDSHHWFKKYPNLIVGMVLSLPEHLWVSDITYIRTLEGFCYLCLITDAYSRKIVGYVSFNLNEIPVDFKKTPSLQYCKSIPYVPFWFFLIEIVTSFSITSFFILIYPGFIKKSGITSNKF
jgi:hypothetical protein